nr:MAG TPA: hypothetical protein [Caudoviricetes sp.]DAI36008.1 MAG TPA: hypothetical protein [Caudoviricetes sp.]DAK69704.1 MAG TPA: hypothetical protein [Caudoviricetes sp.]DAK85248.1 MAG TPA: hypothetical protein [Caudoviricetes sp.]DAN85875.1 MAG TPA: hypothetical protein [Caudoviricetes sp.]
MSSAPTGNCLIVPRQIADMVGGLIPVASASSFWVMFASASKAFK